MRRSVLRFVGMKSLVRGSVLLGSGCWWLLAACDETRPVAPIHDGIAECEVLARVCEDPAQLHGARYQECYDFGRVGDGKGCLANYDECSPLCEQAGGDGAAECDTIGELCHEPGEVYGGRYEECHDIGHENRGPECKEAYQECFDLCDAVELPGHDGEGGAGGESHGASGEGGAGGH